VHRPSRSRGLAALSLLALLALSACSGDEAPEVSAEPAQATSSPTASAGSATPSEEPDEEPSEEPDDEGSGAAQDDAVLGAKEASIGGQPALFEVVSLRRDGELAFLDLRLTNRGTESAGLAGGTFGTGVLDNTLAGVSLVDGTNRTRHVPVRDDQDRCLCSRTLTSVQPGASIALTATYAAPPEDVDRVTVDVPEVGTFDVPISG
jgi:hypothetical protein